MSLQSKTVVVTGAAGSLGQAVAQRASELGATVVGLDIVDAAAMANCQQYHRVDLMDRAATAACFAQLGELDALVNVAGGFAMGDAATDADSGQWDWMFKINVDTLRNACMAAVPTLVASGGAVVNIGAYGALSGQGAMSAYCCAKSSVMRYTESLSEEVKHQGVNVNAVLPSIIDTPPNREGMPDADFDTWVKPSQLADVICFLLSDAASAVHGALIPVRGRA